MFVCSSPHAQAFHRKQEDVPGEECRLPPSPGYGLTSFSKNNNRECAQKQQIADTHTLKPMNEKRKIFEPLLQAEKNKQKKQLLF